MAEDPDPDELREHINQELTRTVSVAVRYAMKQGFSEADVRRTVERVLNETRHDQTS